MVMLQRERIFLILQRSSIPANRTSAKGSISVKADVVKEEIETFKITIGNDLTANAQITPKVVSFEILNTTSTKLTSNLTWETDIDKVTGLEVDAEDVVDVALLTY